MAKSYKNFNQQLKTYVQEFNFEHEDDYKKFVPLLEDLDAVEQAQQQQILNNKISAKTKKSFRLGY